MRVLIFHGYLLRGTGSNVYNANLARAFARLGHDVHLLCQDREARELSWVNAVGAWPGGRLTVQPVREPAWEEGSVTVYTPEIGGLLPVYVADRYRGFEVKTYPELDDPELDRYLRANVDAVADVVERAGPPDAALANHLVMGPVILARAGLRFAVKVHGSDLSYTVMPHPERFVPYALEGTEAASGVLVGSAHTAEDLWATLEQPGLRDRTRLGPPGVDVGRFRKRTEREAERALEDLASTLDRPGAGTSGPGESKPAGGMAASAEGEDSFGRDGPAAAAALRAWARGSPRVLFVGKLLVNKGVDLLAAAWPLIHERDPGARLLLAGFGAFREGLEELIAALGRGDLEAASEVARRGRAYEGGGEGGLSILAAFLADPPGGYAAAAKAAAGTISIAGRLEHDEVAEAMPAANAMVMPSTFPEAFGMVAAEAAACGVPPVSAAHSGMREVSKQLADAVGSELAPLLSFEVGPGAVEAIAARVGGWLELEGGTREELRRSLAARVGELWSWEGVARGVVAASLGELDSLPEVPGGAGE